MLLRCYWDRRTGTYPTTLNDAQVTFDGVAAPLLYVAPTQINVVIPFHALGTTNVCVVISGKSSNCIVAVLAPAAPGIFVVYGTSDSSGNPYAAAVNQDGTINTQQNPASRGSFIALFATGLGSLSQAPIDGTVVPLPLLVQTMYVNTVWNSAVQPHVGQLTIPASWAGQAPLEVAGLSQINVRVPDVVSSFSLQVNQSSSGPVYPNTWSSNVVSVWVK
jgi:uncharacterized protein (TIGR03437 family)